MKIVRVNLFANSYNIYIDQGILQKIGDILVKEKKPKVKRILRVIAKRHHFPI